MHNPNDIILAIVGLTGSGKSVLTEYLTEKYQLERIYFGGYVIEEVERRGLEITPMNEKEVREGLREEHGMSAVAKLALPDIQAALKNQKQVIIDGIYSFSEYVLLKKELGERLKLVAVHCPRTLRYERLSSRNRRPLSREEVDQRDYFEIMNLEKGGPIAIADYHIVNDSDLSKLHEAIEVIARPIWGSPVNS
jgi:dephospho-CoA kinase